MCNDERAEVELLLSCAEAPFPNLPSSGFCDQDGWLPLVGVIPAQHQKTVCVHYALHMCLGEHRCLTKARVYDCLEEAFTLLASSVRERGAQRRMQSREMHEAPPLYE